jgi:glucuronoarabinoxylan endo-1,4-beta-xylanase
MAVTTHASIGLRPRVCTYRLSLTLRLARGLLALVTLACCFGHATRAAPATIDLAASRQTIRGFGGATVFQPPNLPASLTESELDTLFGNAPGQIGFTILRIRVAEDAAWRAVELAHAQAAIARGAIVMATPWSPPAAMKSNGSRISGHLLPASYAAYATYLNDFAKYMAAHGAPLHAISIQNEPDYQVTYESCDWTPAQMLDFCRNNAGRITATRVMAPESFQFRWAMSDPILNDSLAASQVDIIGGHIYGGGLARYPLAESLGKEVWMTEHLELTTDWAGALATGREIHECLATAGFNAYIWWYLRRYYGPLGEDGVVTKRGQVMTQFAKFIRPGYVRVAATANPATGVYVSAYTGEKLVVVAINQGASPVSQTFAFTGGSTGAVVPWVTSASLGVAQQAALAVAGGSFTAELPAGSVTTFVGELTRAAPVIIAQPRGHTVAAGSMVVLEVGSTGEFVSYQWSHDGVAVPGARQRMLTLDAAQPSDAGAYAVTITNSAGSVTSEPASLVVATGGQPGRLVNISTRSPVAAGDSVQIGGFVIEGTSPKQVLVRAAGPVLGDRYQVPDSLADPVITLHDQATGAQVATNDNWDAALAPVFTACSAFSWTPGSKDAALVATLAPGAYTAVVRSATEATGVALVEIYETPGGPADSKLVNLSSRTLARIGADVQIAGFYIGGSTARTVLIRASGPALARVAGLSGTLADPIIELRDPATNRLLATTDNWDALAGTHFASAGAFAWRPDSRDAALLVTLDPGSYTAIVRDRNGGSGLALVEVYAMP